MRPTVLIVDDHAEFRRSAGALLEAEGFAVIAEAADGEAAIAAVERVQPQIVLLDVPPACGGAFSNPRSTSCFQPGWSPDGTKIVFTRISANGTRENIYTVNSDGSGLAQITNTGRADQPDWGPHPQIP